MRNALIVSITVGMMLLLWVGHLEDVANARQQQEWEQFSAQHHCRIVRQSTFTEPQVLWQCDGFQVSRR